MEIISASATERRRSNTGSSLASPVTLVASARPSLLPRWLLAQRVKKAQSLLLETDAPIADIALTAGFCEQGHLTRVFRSLTDTTPAV